jgi:hypothetical protein
MRAITFAIVAIFLARAAYGAAPAISIEDHRLHAVPAGIAAIVIKDQSFDAFKQLGCKTAGTEVALHERSASTAWFITTANECGWGAALGSIWIVGGIGPQNSVLLATNGYAVIAAGEFHHDMADLTIAAGTARADESRAYIFDGRVYGRHTNRRRGSR